MSYPVICTRPYVFEGRLRNALVR